MAAFAPSAERRLMDILKTILQVGVRSCTIISTFRGAAAGGRAERIRLRRAWIRAPRRVKGRVIEPARITGVVATAHGCRLKAVGVNNGLGMKLGVLGSKGRIHTFNSTNLLHSSKSPIVVGLIGLCAFVGLELLSADFKLVSL